MVWLKILYIQKSDELLLETIELLKEIHRYTWLSNWFMGRGLKKRTEMTE
jgi:hypothetical protein